MAIVNIARRRRGVAISSIIRLEKHVFELEGKESYLIKVRWLSKDTLNDLRTLTKTSRVFIAASSTWLRGTRKSCSKNKPS